VHLFTGEEFDLDLGLYYLRARYHNPDTGRFWSQDSFEGFGNDPTSLHKYTYCGSNPVNASDPSGNWTLTELGISTATASGITWGFWGALSGAYTTFRHIGNQFGWNMAVNAGIGGAVGFVGGYFLGPLPPTAWTTGAGPWMLALLSGIAANSAVQEYQAGYGDLAALDAAFAICPLMLTTRQLVIVQEARSGGLAAEDAANAADQLGLNLKRSPSPLPQFSRSTVDEVVLSSREPASSQIQQGARAIAKKLGHAKSGGFKSAFDGQPVSQASAEQLIRDTLSNPSRVFYGNTVIDVYNVANQGVRFDKATGTFIGFLEGTLATQ